MPVVTLMRVVRGGNPSLGPGPAGVSIEEITALHATGFRAELERFVRACGGDAGPRPRGTLAALATRPGRDVRCRVARAAGADGSILGIVALIAAGGPPARHSIGWLLVHPQGRRRGIGTALVAAALEDVRMAGGDAVWVETAAAWGVAAFWQAAGFRQAGGAGRPLV